MKWVVLLVIVAFAATIAVIFVYAARRWKSGTEKLRASLDLARRPIGTKTYDPSELIGLPEPVQRYFRAALSGGQQVVAAVNVEHSGTFNQSDARQRWKPFVSTQRVVTQRPCFDWDARIAMMPGVAVCVHDAYIAGEGLLHAALFGLVPLADLRGTPALAQGELMRFFAEAAWYPTALLPSQEVQWKGVDDRSAMATLRDRDNEVTLLFRFNERSGHPVVQRMTRLQALWLASTLAGAKGRQSGRFDRDRTIEWFTRATWSCAIRSVRACTTSYRGRLSTNP